MRVAKELVLKYLESRGQGGDAAAMGCDRELVLDGKLTDWGLEGTRLAVKEAGGDGSAPQPFDLFLASIATCAGIYVLGFCQQRGISAEGIKILQRMHTDPLSGLVARIDLEIQLLLEADQRDHDLGLRLEAGLGGVGGGLEDGPVHVTTSTATGPLFLRPAPALIGPEPLLSKRARWRARWWRIFRGCRTGITR